MTEQTQPQQALTIAKSGEYSVRRYGDDRQIQMEIKALKVGLPNMQDKPDAAIAALLIASKQSGLNPYRGEIYYTDKGVTVASKVKAADAITAAAKRGDSLDIKFYPFTHNHPLWAEMAEPDLSENDTAVLCEIISSRARREWYKDRLARIDELKALGYARPEIEAKLKEEFPAAPVYRSVGIVKGAEDFGDSRKKFVAFTRKDRAMKRALTKCLNAHGLSAPDQRQYGSVQIVDETVDESPEEGHYTVSTPAQVMRPMADANADPDFAAATAESVDQPSQAPADAERKLDRDNGTDGDAPFGQSSEPKTEPAIDTDAPVKLRNLINENKTSTDQKTITKWLNDARAMANLRHLEADLDDNSNPKTLKAAIQAASNLVLACIRFDEEQAAK